MLFCNTSNCPNIHYKTNTFALLSSMLIAYLMVIQPSKLNKPHLGTANAASTPHPNPSLMNSNRPTESNYKSAGVISSRSRYIILILIGGCVFPVDTSSVIILRAIVYIHQRMASTNCQCNNDIVTGREY